VGVDVAASVLLEAGLLSDEVVAALAAADEVVAVAGPLSGQPKRVTSARSLSGDVPAVPSQLRS
jgi:hypothetical protein